MAGTSETIREADRDGGSAWENAAALGIDMSLIESSLQATPDQRVLWHDQALSTLLLFEQAARKSHG
jgi:hypothetical protein